MPKISKFREPLVWTLFSACSYIGFTFLILIFPYTVQDLHFLIVYLALPCSNIAACRSIIAFFIVIERVMALYFPRIYRISIERVPNWLVFTVGACFGASENLALFVICSYDMEIPEACRFFGCAINKCFFKFWSMHRGVSWFEQRVWKSKTMFSDNIFGDGCVLHNDIGETLRFEPFGLT